MFKAMGSDCGCGCGCGTDETMLGGSFVDFLSALQGDMRPASLVDLFPQEPELVQQFDDGHYEFEVAGFGPDDLDTTVTDELVTFNFANEVEEVVKFSVALPKNVTDINIKIDKGVMHLTLVFKPCAINVNFV